MKPKVLLDIAFLGHSRGTHRGAERVVRQLFEGLYASDQLELSLVATSHLAGVYDFLRSRGEDATKKLEFASGRLLRSRMDRALSDRIHRSMGNRSAAARAGRYALAQVAQVCALGGSKPRAEWLERAQIYHSPHTPFSPEIHQNRKLKKFITCLDFIPLKNPEYYPPGIMHFMEGVLASLRPENFAFCISETTRADLLTYTKMPPERVFVTPLAADATVFHPVQDAGQLAAVRKQYDLGDEPYFLALSAHDHHKNFPHLIECFGSLVESGELADCNLVIVGPNPGRNPDVQAAIDRFPKAARRIRVPGFVADEDLAAVYSGSVAFLFPSLAEGFGIPPLEAMHCGVPVIASNTTSIPEVVGDAGLLLSPTDKDAWCAAILRVARDASFRAELSRRSPERARLFSWQRFIDETIRGYKASIERF